MEIVKNTSVGLKMTGTFKDNESGAEYPGIMIQKHLVIYNRALDKLVLYTNYSENKDSHLINLNKSPEWGDNMIKMERFIKIYDDKTLSDGFYPYLELSTESFDDGWVLYVNSAKEMVITKTERDRTLIIYSTPTFNVAYERPIHEMLIPALMLCGLGVSVGIFGAFGLILLLIYVMIPFVFEVNFNGADVKYLGFIINRSKIVKYRLIGDIYMYKINGFWYMYYDKKLNCISSNNSSLNDVVRKALSFISEKLTERETKLLSNG